MAPRFRGESLHKVDGKGRVSIPALFRRVLEAGDPDRPAGDPPGVVIVYGLERQRHLTCYTMEAIAEIDAEIEALPLGSRRRKLLELVFNGKSLPTSVDEGGRLVLPVRLRDKLGLTDAAYFVGAGKSFQIWNPALWEQEIAPAAEAAFDDLPVDFDPLSLLDPATPEPGA